MLVANISNCYCSSFASLIVAGKGQYGKMDEAKVYDIMLSF